jgi:hypothetical protein
MDAEKPEGGATHFRFDSGAPVSASVSATPYPAIRVISDLRTTGAKCRRRAPVIAT